MLPEAEGLFYPKQQIVLAARAAGILPLGFIGTVADYKDLDAFRATVRRSRRLGFTGASVIHPSQVPILNAEFRPSAEEVQQARRILVAFEEASKAGRGAIEVDGKMVDIPVVDRARGVIERHDAIERRIKAGRDE
jgi:citrate lyase subunit beta/citryl-CoA lyase